MHVNILLNWLQRHISLKIMAKTRSKGFMLEFKFLNETIVTVLLLK